MSSCSVQGEEVAEREDLQGCPDVVGQEIQVLQVKAAPNLDIFERSISVLSRRHRRVQGRDLHSLRLHDRRDAGSLITVLGTKMRKYRHLSHLSLENRIEG